LTPYGLEVELAKLSVQTDRVFVTNIKSSYRDEVIAELDEMLLPNVEVMTIGKNYEFAA
jgi:hypothetical protein